MSIAQKNYINGEWCMPQRALSVELRDSSTGEFLLAQRAASALELEKALQAAQKVHMDHEWASLSNEVRADRLERVAEELDEVGEDIAAADSRTTGVLLSSTRHMGLLCAATFRVAAQTLRDIPGHPGFAGPHGQLRLERLPLGVAAIIAPWNAPSGIACHKLASALAAGCPVLYKPSEWAPLSAQIIAGAFSRADLPAGLFQLLHGDAETGATLVRDKRVAAVSFTGGLAGGRSVAAACAEQIKPAQLELGGNNPLIVLEDADVDAAVEGIVTALITLNGQWCRALGRLLVHEARMEEVLNTVLETLTEIKMGSAFSEDADMGPMAHRAHRDLIAAAVQRWVEEGGEAHQPTPVPETEGYFFPPTLVTGLPPSATQEEIFGPVAAVHSFADDNEAVQLANGVPYGLAAYVFGSEERANRVANQLHTGVVKLNAVTLLSLNPMAPRPAWKLSGLGDEGTLETFEFFRGSRVVGAAGPAPAAA